MSMLPWLNFQKITFSAALVVLYLFIGNVLPLPLVSPFTFLGWPTAGIALAVIVLYGYTYIPAIFFGAFLSGVTHELSFTVALTIAIGHTLGALLGRYILERYFQFDSLIGKVRDVMAVIIAAFLSAIPTASLSVMSLALAGFISDTEFTFTWGAWLIGDVLGILTVMPFLIRWLSRPLFTRTIPEIFEAAIAIGSLAAISCIIFWQPLAGIEDIPLFYFLFLPLTWIAFRIGPRGMSLSLFLLSGIALLGVSSGYGFFKEPATNEGILSLQILLIVSSILFLIFVSLEEERKEAVKALRIHVNQIEQALEKVRSTDQAKNQLIAILAHELRNPLAPIVSSLDLIKINAEISPHLIGTIDTHVRSMVRLLDDLLDLSRISRQKFKLKKEIVELVPLIIRSIETAEPLIKSREHRLTLVVEPKQSLWVNGDPLRLEQIFVNLLNNAAKYTNIGGKIRLTVSEENGTITVSIEDNGIGINPHMLKEIFEPFVQVKEQSYKNKGLGLGLSLTKELVELHEGSIEVKSEGEGKGSTFTVTLSAAQEKKASVDRETKQVTPVHPHPPKSFKILVVDDNEAAVEGLATLLRHYKNIVEVAYDGESALLLTERFAPEVIILDIGLPGMDGYEVAQKLRKEKKSSAVLIALTGYGQIEDKQKADESGFNYHLTKPVGIADLRAILNQLQ